MFEKKKIMSESTLKIVIPAVIIVIACAIGWFFTLRPGIRLDDSFYYRTGEGRYENLKKESIVKEGNDRIRFQLKEQEETVSVEETFNNQFEVRFSDGSVQRYKYLLEDFLASVDGEGNIDDFGITVGTSNVKTPVTKGALGSAAVKVFTEDTTTVSAPLANLLGILFFIIGTVVFLFPEATFMFGRRWLFERAELSSDGQIMQKGAGVLFMILGVIFMTGLFAVFSR